MFVAEGASAGGVGAVTPGLPAGIQADDILILFVETRSGHATSVSNENGGTWTPVGAQDVTGTTSTRLSIAWSRYNGTQGNPTVADSGNHQYAVILAFRGCVNTGDPYEGLAGGVDATSDTTLTASGSSTTGADRLVIVAASRDPDDAGPQYSGWANADLANIVERHDAGTTAGDGGGLGIITGEKASSGAYGSTTATLANASGDAFFTFALIPAATGGATVTFEAAVAGAGAVSPALVGQRALAAAIAGAGAVSPALVGQRALAAAIAGAGSVAVSQATQRALAASVAGTGAVSVDVVRQVAVEVAVTGSAVLSLSLAETRALQAALAGTGLLAITLDEPAGDVVVLDTGGAAAALAALYMRRREWL